MYQIVHKFGEYNENSKVYEEIRNYKPKAVYSEVVQCEEELKEEQEQEDEIKEEALREVNADYKLWLQIEGTNIDYPVVQGGDNKWYLEHDFYNNLNAGGTLFIDCAYKEGALNQIIYGHNMKNQTMFSALNQFKEEAFFEGYSELLIYEEGQVKKYKIFAVYAASVEDSFYQMFFKNDEDYAYYIRGIYERAYYSRPFELDYKPRLITLSTCSYEYRDARTLVHAYEIRE